MFKVVTRSSQQNKGDGTNKDGEDTFETPQESIKGVRNSQSLNWTKSKISGERKNRKPDCSFRLWASWMKPENSFQIKSLKPEHKCSINYNLGSLVTYR